MITPTPTRIPTIPPRRSMRECGAPAGIRSEERSMMIPRIIRSTPIRVRTVIVVVLGNSIMRKPNMRDMTPRITSAPHPRSHGVKTTTESSIWDLFIFSVHEDIVLL
jgi:hypothetical protein